MNLQQLTSTLHKQLQHRLPGKTAHLKMMPATRNYIRRNTKEYTKAAVLLLIYNTNSPKIVFIKRPSYKGAHSGQVSFPGGKQEFTDHSLIHTALRETQEETGFPTDQVRIIGSLSPLAIEVSNSYVYPFIGYTHETPFFKPDPHEVDYLIEGLIAEILNPERKKVMPMTYANSEFTVPYFSIEGEVIWGATAMILSEFIDVLAKPK